MSRSLPVVLVHGAGQDAEIWDEVRPLIAAPATAHELPGHGRRGGRPLRSIPAMAEDVTAAVSAPAVLVGHSMGGAVVLEAALAHPEAVAGIVVVCAGLRPRPDRRVLAALRAGSMERFLPYVRPGIVGLGAAVTPTAERSAQRLEAIVARHPIDVLLADYDALGAVDLTGRLGALAIPAAVLAGERDALVRPRRAAALAAELGVVATVVPAATHQVPWEAPDAVAAAIEEVRSRASA